MNTSWHSYPRLSDAYIAGFFDGEGSIGIYKNRGSADRRYKRGHRPPGWIRTVTIANTNHAVLDEILQITGLGVIRAKSNTMHTVKPMYYWAVNSKSDIETFLLRVMPHLYEKREQARTLLMELRGALKTEEAAAFLKQAKRMLS